MGIADERIFHVGRKREPIECTLPFSYWVFGRPISYRNEDGGKPKALGPWRRKIVEAVLIQIASETNGRMYIPFDQPVELLITWLSTNTSNPQHPDVDNILKPFIDALNRNVITDDINVHRILAEKGDLNRPPSILNSIFADIQDDPEFRSEAEVTVVRVIPLAVEQKND